MTTGEKLAQCRRALGMTQEQLAEKMHLSRQSVSRWEMDAAFPETDKLIRLSRLFGCSIDYLLSNTAAGDEAKGEEALQSAFFFIRSCGCFFLATVQEGVPHIRPMGMIGLWEGKLLLCTDKRKQVYRELKENGEAEIAAYHMESRKWIRIHGKAMEETSLTAMEEMMKLYPMISQEYAGQNRQQAVLFRIEENEVKWM